MPDFASPFWLLGLAVVPLIRWLHRWRAPLSHSPVSALFLWKATASESMGSESRRTPDPAWRRRALIAFFLVVALANPFLPKDETTITVWVDDTFSMRTIENSQTRLAAGLSELRAALKSPGTTTLRSFRNPAKSVSAIDSRAFDETFWLDEVPLPAKPPPPALMSADAAHWLITDGTSTWEWAGKAPISRIVNMGRDTENAGIVRLAARRSLESPSAIDVLIVVVNAGDDGTERELLLSAGTEVHNVGVFRLSPGAIAVAHATLVGESDELVATLVPADALVADDTLRMSMRAFEKIPVLVDAGCPSALQRAVDSHDALQRAGSNADMQLICSDAGALAPHSIRFLRDTPEPLSQEPTWLPVAGDLQNVAVPAAWIRASRWPGSTDGRERVLVAGDDALVVRDSLTPGSVETVIDMSHTEFVDQPEYAAFVAGLIDLAMGRSLLDPIAIAARDPLDSSVVPRRLQAAARPSAIDSTSLTGFAGLMIALAVLVLLIDIFIVWRARRDARHA